MTRCSVFNVALSVALAAATATSTHPTGGRLPSWSEWQQLHRKRYSSDAEAASRRAIFEANLATINAHNERYAQGMETYTMKASKWADLTAAEFRATRPPISFDDRRTLRGTSHMPTINTNTSDAGGRGLQPSPPPTPPVDWVALGAVNPSVDSGYCTAAYAFAAVGAAEGAWFKKFGRLVQGSVQNVLDCSYSWGNSGCSGGYGMSAINWIAANGLVDGSPTGYTYLAADGPYCAQNSYPLVLDLSTAFGIPLYSDPALTNAIATAPTIVYVESGSQLFQLYDSGVITNAFACGPFVDTYALAVGMGTDMVGGVLTPYFTLRMDYGPGWGENGFVRIKRDPAANSGAGVCGIYAGGGYWGLRS